MIGKLEEMILMGCVRAGPDAVPSEIYKRVLAGNPDAAFGAVYTTLVRMKAKGLLDEGAQCDQSGRKRRVFTINGKGRCALSDALRATARIGGFSIEEGFHVLAS